MDGLVVTPEANPRVSAASISVKLAESTNIFMYAPWLSYRPANLTGTAPHRPRIRGVGGGPGSQSLDALPLSRDGRRKGPPGSLCFLYRAMRGKGIKDVVVERA